MDKFSASLGQRLRVARRQRGWSLGEVEVNTGGEFKASVVGAYERGERAISVQRFVRIADLYGFTPAELLPMPPDVDVIIDIDSLSGDDGDRLAERYLSAIKLLRRDPGGPEVRHSDLAGLGALLQVVDTPANAD